LFQTEQFPHYLSYAAGVVFNTLQRIDYGEPFVMCLSNA